MGGIEPTREIEPEKQLYAMQRACELARRASGQTAPNPMVGCVIMQGPGTMVGHGWHKGPGRDHAETMALKEAGDAARGATAFVTLEPCNHTGRTGPCSEALIEAGIAHVVYAVADPNPLAAGGAERLREAGINVSSGLCEREARSLIRAWVHAIKTKRPFVTGKTAMSLDGRTATTRGESQWITSEASRKFGHGMRREADAILVGANTVIADDPALTARMESTTHYPLRVVLDSTARTSPGAKVYEHNGKGALLVTTNNAPADRLAAFQEVNVDTLTLPANDNGRPALRALLKALYERDIHHLMIEGGGEVLGAFFDADLLDEIEIFIAPKLIGGGKPAFGGRGIESLSDNTRFTLTQLANTGRDQHWRATRRTTEAA